MLAIHIFSGVSSWLRLPADRKIYGEGEVGAPDAVAEPQLAVKGRIRTTKARINGLAAFTSTNRASERAAALPLGH